MIRGWVQGVLTIFIKITKEALIWKLPQVGGGKVEEKNAFQKACYWSHKSRRSINFQGMILQAVWTFGWRGSVNHCESNRRDAPHGFESMWRGRGKTTRFEDGKTSGKRHKKKNTLRCLLSKGGKNRMGKRGC